MAAGLCLALSMATTKVCIESISSFIALIPYSGKFFVGANFRMSGQRAHRINFFCMF